MKVIPNYGVCLRLLLAASAAGCFSYVCWLFIRLLGLVFADLVDPLSFC